MEILIGVLALITGLSTALVPYLWKRYITRPEITIQILLINFISSNLGLSSKNELNDEGFIDGNNAINMFELTWKFKIRITNNSDLTAFFPELKFNPAGPTLKLIDSLDKYNPLKSAESIELSLEYKKFEEKTGKERTVASRELPVELNHFGLLLSYQNSYKSKFYTLFNNSDKSNVFLRYKPSQYITN